MDDSKYFLLFLEDNKEIIHEIKIFMVNVYKLHTELKDELRAIKVLGSIFS